MGIFSSIKNAIFGEAKAETISASTEAVAPISSAESTTSTAAETAAVATPVVPVVDVAAILDTAVKASGQKLDWKHSIVDLLKALKIDSSLTARKELASELGYSGNASDSATLNVWLHKAVIKKLSENGGQVPADLLD
ncbi:DUF3597 domain-containing protein (plasmid) [Agrobacterium tumefaciens]|jgi:hypothetical protein|uniref:DUF3597 domain-containing protein n=1 Tax=Agrobacterium tumefaciens TaxID=358 RepID=A0AAP9E9U5_AGRTU|nr:DUF3597 domain-containing protein [Agrobacterium tumefaciens]NSZ60071.1 DUF3597 domain-containing protein [Agrobacterium tumefaciens]QDY97671.1 DUF3597 domain-containing protein [Agrobacterium tumefaciens]UXS12794.1 DUF3597 domain-containing protein [Agrobacterium tumefaciens]UXS20155.1 DUF3597 domain-containing protein [Agrobacterium tumefaciens]UXS27803.1 DUF3597 domain-containing protein [Agrobacterium tumefaciens]